MRPFSATRRLLVVDDNEAIHADFDKILSRPAHGNDELDALDAELFGAGFSSTSDLSVDFELCHALQGQDALEVLKKDVAAGGVFGAAFVDMRMPPGWDGVETIEHLWKVDPHLQVVICTAYSDHSWEDITDRLGSTDRLLILKKPFDEIEVVQLATSLCEKRRLLEESVRKMESLEHVVDEQAAELQAAHENAETLIQSISSVLISLDGMGQVSRWNAVAAEVFGLRKQDVVGRSFMHLPIQWTEPDSVMNLLLELERGEVQFETSCNQVVTLDMHVCRILGEPAETGKLIVANDVTRQKSLQSQLDQAQRLESVGQLAAGVAHEINTPMQYIGDNVRYVAKTLQRMNTVLDCLPALVDESISDDDLIELRNSVANTVVPRKVKSALRQIPEALADSIEGVEAVSRIVAAMKEFSHPGSDNRAEVAINHILESTITVARNEWKYVAEVETDFEDNLPGIPAFSSELNQAFLNIIVNAAHAIGDRVERGDFDKGRIRIATRHNEEFVVVTIQDNGGGIPEHVRNRVFEPFFTTKDVGKGTGQGLAIAHSVVTSKHGGGLSFDVEEGIGTTFIIQLPLHPEEEQAEEVVAVAGGVV